jgi:nitrate/nitrite transport system permease protein
MDEPGVQLRKIFNFIVIPVIAFAIFVGLWNYIAPRHTTKSGEVPTPPVVLQAWDGILNFHYRENQKMADFKLTGDERKNQLAMVSERLEAMQPEIEASSQALKEAEIAFKTMVADKVAPLEVEYEAKKSEFAEAAKAREASLKAAALSIKADDKAAKEKLLADVKADRAQDDIEKDILNTYKDKMDAVRSLPSPELKAAKKANSILMSEQLYLNKRKELLGEDNRDQKVAEATSKLDETKASYLASTGTSLLIKAKSIVRNEESIGRIESSDYAKPWTFLDQIVRSLGCVFLGFGIAIVIAIPMGILCGLSKIFMAAMMPLIALFKPVSPIVWLPIVFIIVGGFIDNPEKAPVHPAFLSSAITVALCSLWPTLVNTALGVASIDKDYINVARVLKLGFFARLFKIVIPSALPLMFAGLRISLGVGWMVLVAAELLSSSEGIGKFVWDMFNNGSSETFAQMFVVVFVVGIVGLLLDRIMIVLQRLVSFEASASNL